MSSALIAEMRRLRALPGNSDEANRLIDEAIAVQVAAEGKAGKHDTAGVPPKAEQPVSRLKTGGFVFRVHPLLVRYGTLIRTVYQIQIRKFGTRRWMMMVIEGRCCRYFDRETADRHCRWLNDPQGTEPEWGKDESPNAPRSATEGRP